MGVTHRGSPRDPAQRRIADVLTAYAEERGAEAVDGARIGYAIKALLPFWGSCAVGDVREQTCRAYARTRGKSPGTIRRELSTLRSAIKYDFTQGRLTATPAPRSPRTSCATPAPPG